jgi:CshA-type fibril repeat protein
MLRDVLCSCFWDLNVGSLCPRKRLNVCAPQHRSSSRASIQTRPGNADSATSCGVTITGSTGAGTPLVVAGEGTWTVNTITRAITLTPLATFTGDPTPITYTVKDNDGNTSNVATVSVDCLTQPPVAQDDAMADLPINTNVVINPCADNGNGADADPDGLRQMVKR